MVIFGVILLLVAGGLFYGKMSSQKKLGDMAYTDTSEVSTLLLQCKGVADDIGGGSFSEYCEIKGTATLGQPLKAEFSGTDCVYYKTEVIREWEEEVFEEDHETGEQIRKMERKSEVMSTNLQAPDFWLDDGSGKMKIRPTGAKIDAMKSFDNFEPHNSGSVQFSDGNMTWGNFSFSIGQPQSQANLIGYRFREWSIPLGQSLYVIGQASDESGELLLTKPKEKKSFVISTKSEEELIQSAEKSGKIFMVASIICAVLGLVLIAVGIVR